MLHCPSYPSYFADCACAVCHSIDLGCPHRYLSPVLDLSPTHKLSTIVPLFVLLTATAIKEGVEDWFRHKEDKKVNSLSATTILEGNEITVPWQSLRVGQIVKVRADQQFPADLVMLQSSAASGKCYVETADLDGETNLKIRVVSNEMQDMYRAGGTVESLLGAHVECDHPNRELYSFKGCFTLPSADRQGPDTQLPLDNSAVLLRGAILRNTEHIIGAVVYTGSQTKLSMNAIGGRRKRSNIEFVVDRLIAFIFLILLGVIATSSMLNVAADKRVQYLPFLSSDDTDNSARLSHLLKMFVTFLILFNTFVPISLYVTLEMVKVYIGMLINRDAKMYYGPRNMWAQARTSNLHEDMGQIKYVFSDKTGTLTQNVMKLKKAAFGGRAWQFFGPTGGTEAAPENLLDMVGIGRLDDPATKASAVDFFTALAVCHTVVPELDHTDHGAQPKIRYSGESPDEEALVQGAADLGFQFVACEPKVLGDGTQVDTYRVAVELSDTPQQLFETHEVNGFDSTRKRMSIVVRDDSGKWFLYAKGADMMMEADCGVVIPAEARASIGSFSTEGLRTLVVAKKELDPRWLKQWRAAVRESRVDLEQQTERMAAHMTEIEQGMTYVGISAIEDKLQDGVPETIARLRMAGIKIWVLTGDKEETAVNIAKACRLIDYTFSLACIRGSPADDPTPYSLEQILGAIESALADARDMGDQLALVIDGKALGEIFREYSQVDHAAKYTADAHTELQLRARKLLVECGDRCAAVIGCRVSPRQKRDIVRLVQDNVQPRPMTLAIGDGANDVAMIQEARIGIGISGNEGTQAVRSSDYAIAQFCFLERLLLVHGRDSYRRVCKVIVYCFYKCIAYNLVLFFFGFQNGQSGTSLFDTWLSTGWNVIWTFLPIIATGCLDKDVPEHNVLANPRLYLVGQTDHDLNFAAMVLTVGKAVLHATVVYGLISVLLGRHVTDQHGTTDGLFVMGTTMNCCLQLTVNLDVLLRTKKVTALNVIALMGSALSWFLFSVLYSKVYLDSSPDFYGLATELFTAPAFWLMVLLTPLAALLPDFVICYLQFNYYPTEWDTARKGLSTTDHQRTRSAPPHALFGHTNASDLPDYGRTTTEAAHGSLASGQFDSLIEAAGAAAAEQRLPAAGRGSAAAGMGPRRQSP